MKTTVFDSYLVIRNKDGFPNVDETLDKLDEMLDVFGVKHSFTIPHEVVIEKHPNAVVTLNYNDEDDMLLSLIYGLFCKFYRRSEDKDLAEALAEVAVRHIGSTKEGTAW